MITNTQKKNQKKSQTVLHNIYCLLIKIILTNIKAMNRHNFKQTSNTSSMRELFSLDQTAKYIPTVV